MTKKRKTVQVTELVKKLNSNLLNSDFQDLDRTEGVAFRKGICAAIEQILFSTGNYHGYRFIDKNGEAIKPYAFGCDYSKLTDFVPLRTTLPYAPVLTSSKVEEQVAAFEGSDETRRQYFI